MTKKLFGQWLKQQLAFHSLSYRQFETETGINRSNLSHYISGRSAPTAKRLQQLASFFADVDVKAGHVDNEQRVARRNRYLLDMLAVIEVE